MQTEIALKEWAAVVEALASGDQILIVRKGGIGDPKGAFRLERREFLLYPTREHQSEEKIRPEFRERLRAALQPEEGPQDRVTFRVYAGVAFEKELRDLAPLTQLTRYHIWTPEFLGERLSYRPQAPVAVLVVRAYRLKRAVTHAVAPEYAGCKSWVALREPVSLEGAEPVLDNRRFRAAVNDIAARLG